MKISTISCLSRWVGAFLLFTGTMTSLNAQIVKNYPTAVSTPTSGGCSTCATATATGTANALTADTTTYAQFTAVRDNGLVNQRWVETQYTISPSADNKNLYIRLTAGANTSVGKTVDDNQGGVTFTLSNGGTDIPASSITLAEFVDRHNNTWYRITTESNYTALKVRLTSRNYGTLDGSDRSARLYTIYTTTGSATPEDCGFPEMVSFEGKIDGLPLAGPADYNLWKIIDQDFTSNTASVLAGVANIGAPSWNYTVLFNGLSGSTSTLKLTMGRGVNVVALSGIRYKLHYIRNGAEFASTPDWLTMQVIGLLGINDYSPFTFYHEAPGQFDGVRIEIQVPGVSLVGEYARIFDIRRTVGAPAMSSGGSTTMDVTRNTTAEVIAAGTGTEYIWYQGTRVVDSETNQSSFAYNPLSSLIEATTATPSATPNRTLSTLLYGPVTQDTVLFVRSLRASCPADTSAPQMITLRAVEAPLPVALASFDASRAGQTAALTWVTTEEVNNAYFELERSVDAKAWSQIGTVNALAPNGNSTSTITYNFIDNAPASGVNYYRLVQVDIDGTRTPSRPASVYMDAVAGTSYVYPNPAQHTIQIAAEVGSVVTIYDLLGRIVGQSTVNSGAQDAVISVSHLATGNYFVHVTKNGAVQRHTVSVQR